MNRRVAAAAIFILLVLTPAAGAIQIGRDNNRLTYDASGTKPTTSGTKGTVITLNGAATPNIVIKIYWDTTTD